MVAIDQLEKFLSQLVRPQLATHGGDLEVISLSDGLLRVRLLGQCSGCPSASRTTQEVVAQAVIGSMEGIEAVELVQGVREELLEQARALLSRSKKGL